MFALSHIKTTFPKSTQPHQASRTRPRSHLGGGENPGAPALAGLPQAWATQTNTGSGADWAADLPCGVEQVAQPL